MRKLVTCPVCKTDQHIYRKAIAIHDNGTVRCTGSKVAIAQVWKSMGLSEWKI